MQKMKEDHSHVQKTSKKITSSRLSRLISNKELCLNGRALYFLDKYPSSELTKIIFDHTLPNLLYLYFGKIKTARVPLWFELLRNNGKSLRVLTPEWNAHSKLLIEKLTTLKFKPKLKNEKEKLKFKLLKASKNKKINLQIKIINNKLSNQDVKRLIDEKTNNKNASLKALYYASKVKVAVLNDLEAQRFVELNNSISQMELLSLPLIESLNILNSLNLVELKNNKNYQQVRKSIQRASDLIDMGTEANRIKNHFKGINKFHQATLHGIGGDIGKYESCLKSANKLDYGFYDYSYKLACLYHDQNDLPKAKKHYEEALKASCFNDSLVNDYGVLLKEMRLFSELKCLREFYNEIAG